MDRIAESLKNKQIVFWEEIARDGAQAKTLLSAKQRIEIANMHAEIFGQNAPDHLVFGIGFASISTHERKIIEQAAEEVESCYLGVNCRSNENEISDALHSVRKAKYGRMAFVLPASARLCDVMLHKSPQQTMEMAKDLASYALDKSNGIPIDVQLAGAFDGDPVFVGNLSSMLTREGIATVGMGDTRGAIYPNQTEQFLDTLLSNSTPEVLYSVHFHDDLGFSLSNNIIALQKGIRMPSTSWLGLAERNGLLRTELLTLLLAREPELLKERLGIDGEKLFLSPPKLRLLKKITETVSRYTNVPIKITDPIIGSGLNSISTGTPFVDRDSFRPFNPEDVLGIPEEIFITHLAGTRLIDTVCRQMGHQFEHHTLQAILSDVKNMAYTTNNAVIDRETFLIIIQKHLENVNQF